MGSCRGHASVGRRSAPALANGARYAAISSSLTPLPARRFQRSDSSPARVSDHVSLAHLLSASASWWAIRGVMPIHSTGVPNARMTLPPLAVTAYRSSPSSSGVRAPWVNLPVSPSGMLLARVSAFIAWIVSATFACCTSSLHHRSPWCSSPCIMVSTWGGPQRKCSPSCLVSGLIPAVDDLHLCETAVHEQLRSRDIAAVIGREKHHGLGDLIGCTGPGERNNFGHALQCCSPVSVTCQAGVSVTRGLTAFTGGTGVGIPKPPAGIAGTACPGLAARA